MIRLRPLIFLLPLVAIAQETDPSGTPSPDNAVPLTSYFHILADEDYSMRSAAENFLSIHGGISRLEDRVIGTSWFDESSIAAKAGGMGLRFAKMMFLDTPLDYFSVVAQHEFGGHGARYREFGITQVHYAFDAPPPFGNGGGQATSLGDGFSVDEGIAMWAGGVESHTFLQRSLAMRWVERRSVTYREAFLYFWSWQITFTYIQDTHEDLLDGRTDNDPRAFVRLLNNGYAPLTGVPLRFTVGDLKAATKIGIANPFTFFTIYVGLVSYLYQGQVSADLPMLDLGPMSLLPLFRAGWTPYGVEYHLENYLRMGERTALLDLSVGDNTFHSGWGGAGLDVHRIFDDGHWRLDLGARLWHQPALTKGWNPGETVGSGLGGAWRMRVYQDIHGLPVSLHAVGEIGYKTGGFIEGYPMAASPLLMMGLAIRY